MTGYFRHHVFFCCNRREGADDASCGTHNAQALQVYAKDRIRALGLGGRGGVRISKSGCLGRCGEGPVLVIYPEGVWYTYADEADVEEIITEHLVHGRHVERLQR